MRLWLTRQPACAAIAARGQPGRSTAKERRNVRGSASDKVQSFRDGKQPLPLKHPQPLLAISAAPPAAEQASPLQMASTSVGADEDMASFLSRADFPNHQLIVRPNSGALHPIYKGISSIDTLAGAVRECAGIATDHLARVETDMRAHACPSRRAVIAAAAERLATRIATRCPSCRAPGWGRVDVVLGVPCARCGTEVARPRAEVDGCPSCEYTRGRPLISPQTRVDPGECLYCNP